MYSICNTTCNSVTLQSLHTLMIRQLKARLASPSASLSSWPTASWSPLMAAPLTPHAPLAQLYWPWLVWRHLKLWNQQLLWWVNHQVLKWYLRHMPCQMIMQDPAFGVICGFFGLAHCLEHPWLRLSIRPWSCWICPRGRMYPTWALCLFWRSFKNILFTALRHGTTARIAVVFSMFFHFSAPCCTPPDGYNMAWGTFRHIQKQKKHTLWKTWFIKKILPAFEKPVKTQHSRAKKRPP